MKTITPERARELMAHGAVLVDIREPDEHAREKIAGARNLPLSKLGATPTAATPGQTVLFHCKSGMRTQNAAGALASKAEACEAYIVEGGIEGWKSAGLPVQTDAKQPLELQRQVQLIAGGLVLTGTLLGVFVAPGFLAIPAFVGSGLMFAGATGLCGMAKVLLLAPWNRKAAA